MEVKKVKEELENWNKKETEKPEKEAKL